MLFSVVVKSACIGFSSRGGGTFAASSGGRSRVVMRRGLLSSVALVKAAGAQSQTHFLPHLVWLFGLTRHWGGGAGQGRSLCWGQGRGILSRRVKEGRVTLLGRVKEVVQLEKPKKRFAFTRQEVTCALTALGSVGAAEGWGREGGGGPSRRGQFCFNPFSSTPPPRSHHHHCCIDCSQP